MKKLLTWCKKMFMQKSGQVVLGKKVPAQKPVVQVEENTIFLNRREAGFINKEVHRLLKEKIAQAQRRKEKKIPAPPAPGKITYAVYH